MSEIFARLKLLQPHLAKNRTALAERLGVDESTFSGQIRRQSNNIYPLLPKVFELLPGLSAEWLYLGKGEMFSRESTGEGEESSSLALRLDELAHSFSSLADANQKLLEQNQKLIEQNHSLVEQLLKQNLKGE